MILPNTAKVKSSFEDQFDRRLFTRRTDLSNRIRVAIAINALYAMLHGVWGTISNLAIEYSISRTFVYSLAHTLNEAGQFLFQKQLNSPIPYLFEDYRFI